MLLILLAFPNELKRNERDLQLLRRSPTETQVAEAAATNGKPIAVYASSGPGYPDQLAARDTVDTSV